MFKTRIILVVHFILFVLAIVGFKVFYVSKKDQTQFEKTLDYLQPTSTKHYGQTKRHQVSKNLWLHQDQKLHQYCIQSQGSTLHLHQMKAKETNIVEDMEDVICHFQQKVYFVDALGNEVLNPDLNDPSLVRMQQICCLKVKSGTFDYMSKNFIGDNAEVFLYEVPGHELKEDFSMEAYAPVLKGHSAHLHFFFVEESPHLQLKDLTATLYGKSL